MGPQLAREAFGASSRDQEAEQRVEGSTRWSTTLYGVLPSMVEYISP